MPSITECDKSSGGGSGGRSPCFRLASASSDRLPFDDAASVSTLIVQFHPDLIHTLICIRQGEPRRHESSRLGCVTRRTVTLALEPFSSQEDDRFSHRGRFNTCRRRAITWGRALLPSYEQTPPATRLLLLTPLGTSGRRRQTAIRVVLQLCLSGWPAFPGMSNNRPKGGARVLCVFQCCALQMEILSFTHLVWHAPATSS
jgi:hypothetical protein